MINKLNLADYLLLLLYLNNKQPIKGTTRLQKMMFIFYKEILPKISKGEKNISYNFEAYKFGPFSKDIPEQVSLFKSLNFIQEKEMTVIEEMSTLDNLEEKEILDMNKNQDDEHDIFKFAISTKMYSYEIKKDGIKYVESEIIPNLDQNNLNILQKFKNKIIEISIKNLLFYVYNKYPDFTKNSIIRDEVLNDYGKKKNL
ncbi:MAG: hypothetical protein H9Q65_03395 [Spiroplasma ixodetis]|nr:hypothetical protein [Spiroplasma ixodetis]MBP1528281.1 hypothetical protein [Spiroplasma ixodetis]